MPANPVSASAPSCTLQPHPCLTAILSRETLLVVMPEPGLVQGTVAPSRGVRGVDVPRELVCPKCQASPLCRGVWACRRSRAV